MCYNCVLVLTCAVLTSMAPLTAADAVHWTQDSTGNLIADPVPDYSALLGINVSLDWETEKKNDMDMHSKFAQLCPIESTFAHLLEGVQTEAECFAEFTKVYTWQVPEETQRVAREYFFQGLEVDYTRGNMWYMAQWHADDQSCRVALARGCLFPENTCDFLLRDHDICMKELPNKHVSVAASNLLFDLQRPCAQQYKLSTQYMDMNNLHKLRETYYVLAWDFNASAHDVDKSLRPSVFRVNQPPNYKPFGDGICAFMEDARHKMVWQKLPYMNRTANECPVAIREHLGQQNFWHWAFRGLPNGGNLPTAWLDGWPLIWAFERVDGSGFCTWLNLQNVTHSVAQKLVSDSECGKLKNAMWFNMTVYHKVLEAGSKEEQRYQNSYGDTPEIQLSCPPGHFSHGSTWAQFVADAQQCTSCPAYTYKPDMGGSGRCDPCPVGTGISTTGSKSFQVCDELRDGYVWGGGGGTEAPAVPNEEQEPVYVDFSTLMQRVRDLCQEKPGCNLQHAVAQAACAEVQAANRRFTNVLALRMQSTEIFVPDMGERKLGLLIANNTLTNDTNITVDVLPEPDASMQRWLNTDGSLIQVGTRQTYRPHGLRFHAPVKLFLHVSPDLLPVGAVPAVYYLNTSGIELFWEQVPGSVYDATTSEISVHTTHFSDYVVASETDALDPPAPPTSAPKKTTTQSTLIYIIGAVLGGIFVGSLITIGVCTRCTPFRKKQEAQENRTRGPEGIRLLTNINHANAYRIHPHHESKTAGFAYIANSVSAIMV